MHICNQILGKLSYASESYILMATKYNGGRQQYMHFAIFWVWGGFRHQQNK